MPTAFETLNTQYTIALNEAGILDDSPIRSMFEAFAQILAVILEQVLAFLRGVGLLILDLVAYVKDIITTPKLPKKLRKAASAIQDIITSVTSVFRIPSQFGSLPSVIVDMFQSTLAIVGSQGINLYQLASSVMDTTFFGDLVFAPLFSNILLPSLPGISHPEGMPTVLDIVDPFFQFLVSTVLAPFMAIKAILSPFQPVWDFVRSLASGSPMGFLRSIGRVPSILSRLLSFLLNIKSAFSPPFPTGLLSVMEPILSTMLRPVLAASSGLQDLGITNIITVIANSMVTLFTEGPESVISTLQNANIPSLGLVTIAYSFLRGSIMGAVEILFGPILRIIGFSMDFTEFTLEHSGTLTAPSFNNSQLTSLRFDEAWVTHQAWMNDFGHYANFDRTDILYPERYFDWNSILAEDIIETEGMST